MREVVDQLRSGRIDLEEDVGLDEVDSSHANRAPPERVDAAGNDDLFYRCKVRVDRARRVGDAQIVENHSGRPAADDLHRADIDMAIEAGLERFGHP